VAFVIRAKRSLGSEYDNRPAHALIATRFVCAAGNLHTPYLQDINEALVSGNTAEARRIAQALRRDQNLTPKQLETTLRESIDAHCPIPIGTGGNAFIRWARRSLTPDELARMHHIERVYERTAERPGLPVREEDSGSTPLASAINALRGP
jgi:hypothetical protein